MIIGIGVDLAAIPDFEEYWPEEALQPSFDTSALDPFVRHTFTEAEIAQAQARGKRAAQYLAGRFAVKEAVFKALVGHTCEKGFDLRIVESLDDEYGAPHVTTDGPLAPYLEMAGASQVLVSVSNENDLAIAFALVQ